MRELIRFALRGALGGVTLPLFMTAYYLVCNSYLWFFIVPLIMLLLIPAGIGAAIGILLCLINRKTTLGNGLITRLLIGVSFAALLYALYVYLVQRTSWHISITLGELSVTLILAALEIGMPAGILARARDIQVITRLNLTGREV